MLKLSKIVKNYQTGIESVRALRGIDLSFRESEFVSILGPSGCGKTTLLNIIGGLDKYTDGDLTINGKSTKSFKDRDWDSYRNHSIGFVFQSYNLITHQTVLSNVELALSLSGVSKKERRKRAKAALEQVGLGDQLRKKPTEMSGGQMQRVAIARALVNNPDIILADEPTGALDTETSVQVMDILKEISKNKLVIMVTHNPELAEKYSTRIIRMLDGNIIGDSSPLTNEEMAVYENKDNERLANKSKVRLPSMSFFTSFSLSLKNLFTKRGRTILTSFAGSIGIIGIALIYAVSQGATNYINTVQADTLSSYPLVIESENVDLSSLITSASQNEDVKKEHGKDAIYVRDSMYGMINSINNMETIENDLKTFREYLELNRYDENSVLKDAISGIQYTYNTNLQVYTKNIDGKIIYSDTAKLMGEVMAEFMGSSMSQSSSGATGGSSTLSSLLSSSRRSGSNTWKELLSGDKGNLINEVYYNQYDLIYGSWPNDYNEIVLVVSGNNEVADMTLYALGLESEEQIKDIMRNALDGNEIKPNTNSWSYEEICNLKFKLVLSSSCYSYDEATGKYIDLRETETGLNYLYDNATEIKVVGIIRPSEKAVSTMVQSGTLCYTKALTEYIINESKSSEIVSNQLENPNIDVFNGLPFKTTSSKLSNEEKKASFLEFVDSRSERDQSLLYIRMMSIPSSEELETMVSAAMKDVTRETIEEQLTATIATQTSMSEDAVKSYLANMSDDDIFSMYKRIVEQQVITQYAANVARGLMFKPTSELLELLNTKLEDCTLEEFGVFYDELTEFSSSTYEDNLTKLNCIDLERPSSISIYSTTFENKDVIKDEIDNYNNTRDDNSKISYTDYVGLIMSSVTTIINAITYVLIAFVAISLVVSSIMIGVITLISVQERTKEIGILRAIGASKRNVSSMFNAETLIIGFTSGLFGILITYVLCIPINLIIHALSGIQTLNASLPIVTAGILILISMLLTLFSGIIPSRSAAKKDPVIALRTE